MALSDGIFLMADDERTAEFEEMYFFKFARLAHPEREKARKQVIRNVNQSEEMKEGFLRSAMQYAKENVSFKDVVITGAKRVNTQGVAHALNALVAKEVVKGTVKGTVDQFGRRGAVFAIEQGSNLAAAQGAHAAFNGLKLAGKVGAFLPGLSAAIGQALAENISDRAGVTNHHLKNAISLGGGIAGGAAVGAMIGPVGAAAGAGIGCLGWATGKTFDALYTSGLGIKGPNDNWVYVKTGNVAGQVRICTYGKGDTLYWFSYWKEYRSSNCDMYEMSAGQGQKKSFQLCVWDKNGNVIKHINDVYFRDFIHVGKNKNGKHFVAHGKGELWGNNAGTVDIYSYK